MHVFKFLPLILIGVIPLLVWQLVNIKTLS